MKVVQIHKIYGPLAGAERLLFAVERLLRAHGHAVIPFATANPYNVATPYSSYFPAATDFAHLLNNSTLVDRVRGAARVVHNRRAAERLRQLIEAEQPDVAHAHMVTKHLSTSVLATAAELGVPIVHHLHDYNVICPNGTLLKGGRRLCADVACRNGCFYEAAINRCVRSSVTVSALCAIEAYAARAGRIYVDRVDRFISPSRFLKDMVVKAGIPEEKVDVLANFVDTDSCEVSGSPGSHVLYFGRISPEKGLATLLSAAARLGHVPFVLAGMGPMKEELEQMVAERGLGNVKLVGFKTGAALMELIGESRITVLPSEWYENCPMSILESMARAKPVVGSRIGGITELITEGQDGLTFVPGEAEDLAEKVQRLWDHPEKTREMGRQGRVKIERDHGCERYYESLMAIYGAATHEHGRSAC